VSVVANVAINIDGKDAAKILDDIKRKVEAMNGTFDKVPEATKSIGNIEKAVAGLVAKFVSVAAVTATVKKGIEAAFDLDAARQRIKNLTGSTEEYEVAVALANQAASDFGISQKRATEQFGEVIARVGGLGYGLKEVNEIYRGFDAIAVQSGATADEAAGAFEQLVQALGRGKLQGEDFRSVAGRMPAVLDALASSAGVSRGELQAMASQGKITSDIIFKALSEQAAGFDGLSKRLNEQQKTFNNLSTATEKLLISIGKLFGPAVVAGAKALANAADEIGTFFNFLASKIFPETKKGVNDISGAAQELTNKTLTFGQALKGVLQVATFVGTFAGLIKSVAIGIAIWTKATLLLATAKKALGAAMAFVLGLTVKGLVVVAAAATAAALAADQVGKQIDAIGADIDDFNAKQKASEQAAAGTVDQYSSMPEKIKTAEEANSKLIESTNRVLENVKGQAAAIDAQIASLDRGASVNAARFGAEKAINDLQGKQLERQYELAQTAQQRLNIAIAIFRQQVQAAQIEYKQALENIKLEQRKQELQIQSAQLKYKEIEAEGQLQILKAGSAEEEAKKKTQLDQALAAQNQVVQAAYDNASAQQQIAQYQEQTAAVQLESKMLAAQTALEQKLVSDKIGLSQTEAVRLSTGLKNSQTSSAQLSGSTNQVAKNALGAAGNFIRVASAANSAAAAIGNAANQQARLNALRGGGGGGGAPAQTTTKVPKFAAGGIVTKPTFALIGEAGTEFIVPESKAADFATNYLSGARGTSLGSMSAGRAPTINITTGPVMQQNGQNYVSIPDMERALATLADTMLLNNRTPGGRRYQGVN
jgi:tape measure domain-containing protein